MNDEPGPGVDAQGRAVIDPTANVIANLDAAVKRLDDLREMESKHIREVMSLRAKHYAELRKAEAARLDAIRAVDVAAVGQAATTATAQAAALASQVAVSAETVRTQLEATAKAAASALATSLQPMTDAIADLRRVQYEAQGQKTQVVEARSASSLTTQVLAAGVGLLLLVVAIVGTYLAAHRGG